MPDYDLEEDHITSAIIDELMQTEYAQPPEGILVPAAVWRDQKRNELKEQMTTKPFRTRFANGIRLMETHLHGQIAPEELQRIQDDLAQRSVDFLKNAQEEDDPESDGMESFQELLKISDETIEQMYQVGVTLDKQNAFQDAADVFFVLSVLDYRRHNIWMALGLCEQRLGNMDPALKAYAMAMITDVDDPWSYLHSAECYQALGESTDAEECLATCLTHADHLPADVAQTIRESAARVRNKQ